MSEETAAETTVSTLLLSVRVDVNIWLVTFGFHLHNAIPGFPIPKFDLTQPSLEMKKSQLWDDLPVRILLCTRCSSFIA